MNELNSDIEALTQKDNLSTQQQALVEFSKQHVSEKGMPQEEIPLVPRISLVDGLMKWYCDELQPHDNQSHPTDSASLASSNARAVEPMTLKLDPSRKDQTHKNISLRQAT